MHSAFLEDLSKKPLTRRVLLDLKTRSLRRRVWYRALDSMERGLVDLTIRWVDKVLNSTMARVLLRILGKLAQALEQGMARVLTVGRAIAFKASELAVGWGNGQAYAWRFDKAFWRGLGTVSTPSHHKEDRPDNKKSPMSSVRNVSSVM